MATPADAAPVPPHDATTGPRPLAVVSDAEALRRRRIVVVADEALYGRALARLIETAGRAEVRVAAALDELPGALRRAVADAVVWLADTVDDDTLRPLRGVRAAWPELGLVVVGHHIDPRALTGLLSADPHGFAFVQRGADTQLADIEIAVRQVIRGRSSLDASLVDHLVTGPDAGPGRLAGLSERELAVLALLAQGLRNDAIGREIGRSAKTVEKCVGRIFEQLGLDAAGDPRVERRVRAALVYIQEHQTAPAQSPSGGLPDA